MKKPAVLSAVLLGFAAAAFAADSERHQAHTFPHFYTRSLNERITLEVLQGIVNREEPRLFYTETWTPYNQQWTNVYSTSYGLDFEPVDSLLELINRFRTELNGTVVYDPEVDGSRYVAVTLGGLENLLPVPKGSLLLNQINLPVKYDLTGKFSNSIEAYEWALKELMPRCNRKVAHTPASLNVDGKYIGWGFHGMDYVVAQRGFVFNLGCVGEDMEAFGRIIKGTPKQKKMYERILDELESPALIFGYGEPEPEWFDMIGKHGHTYLHWGDNLSFHSRVKAHNPEFKQKLHFTPETVDVDGSKYYVTFISSEGDSLKGPLPFFFGSWFDPARGSVPVNWGIHPEMVRFPAVLEYYYDTATTNDYFMAVQVFNFDMKNLEGFAGNFREKMKQADLKVTTCDITNPSEDIKQKKYFLDTANPLGAVDCLFEKSTAQGYNRLIGEKNIPLAGTSIHLTYWYRLLPGGWRANWQDMYKASESREQVLSVVLGEIEKEAAVHEPPYLIVVYSDMHAFDKFCELHREVAKRLDKEKYKVVRIDEAFSAMRRWRPEK